jgi:hypothetical protein
MSHRVDDTIHDVKQTVGNAVDSGIDTVKRGINNVTSGLPVGYDPRSESNRSYEELLDRTRLLGPTKYVFDEYYEDIGPVIEPLYEDVPTYIPKEVARGQRLALEWADIDNEVFLTETGPRTKHRSSKPVYSAYRYCHHAYASAPTHLHYR